MSLTMLPPVFGEVEWEAIDFGGTLPGVIGGSDQRLNRLGNRWKMIVTLPSMRPVQAEEWAADLTRGLRTGVAMRVPEPDTPKGAPGLVRVNGAGQAGSSLVVDGGTNGHVVRKGKWFSVVTAGRRYLYKAAESVQLGAGGAGTLQLEPLLRRIPADNDLVEIASPVIEGLLELPPGWKIDRRRIAEGVTFAIREAR